VENLLLLNLQQGGFFQPPFSWVSSVSVFHVCPFISQVLASAQDHCGPFTSQEKNT